MQRNFDMILHRLLQFLETEDYSGDQLEIVKYGIRCFLGELIKITILLLLFSALNLFKEFVFSFIPLILLRAYIGGTHRKTEKGCLLQSAITFTMIILFGKFININFPIACGLYIIFAIGIYLNRRNSDTTR